MLINVHSNTRRLCNIYRNESARSLVLSVQRKASIVSDKQAQRLSKGHPKKELTNFRLTSQMDIAAMMISRIPLN
jgi:hypothetical protein